VRFLLAVLALLAADSAPTQSLTSDTGAATVTRQAVRLQQPAAFVITDIVAGWIPEIDQGLIVLIEGCPPGPGCPFTWLAAHRTTHGAPFARVPELQPGDVVAVVGYRYVVTSNQLVCCVWQEFSPSATLTLQTSATDGWLYIVSAEPEK